MAISGGGGGGGGGGLHPIHTPLPRCVLCILEYTPLPSCMLGYTHTPGDRQTWVKHYLPHYAVNKNACQCRPFDHVIFSTHTGHHTSQAMQTKLTYLFSDVLLFLFTVHLTCQNCRTNDCLLCCVFILLQKYFVSLDHGHDSHISCHKTSWSMCSWAFSANSFWLAEPLFQIEAGIYFVSEHKGDFREKKRYFTHSTQQHIAIKLVSDA